MSYFSSIPGHKVHMRVSSVDVTPQVTTYVLLLQDVIFECLGSLDVASGTLKSLNFLKGSPHDGQESGRIVEQLHWQHFDPE